MAQVARHGACGKEWVQHGNRTGHCSQCHETFEGVSLFEWHQTVTDSGRVVCARPGDERWEKKNLMWTGQSWRQPFKKPKGWE